MHQPTPPFATDDHPSVPDSPAPSPTVDAVPQRPNCTAAPTPPQAPEADPGPAPEMLRGSDGTALVYRGSRVLLSVEPEAGKSWAALVLAVERMQAGERVA